MVSGLVAWLAILLLLIATRDSTAAIAIGGNGLAIPFGPAAAAFIGLLYLLYVSVLFAQIPSDVTIQPAKFDKWRYVVPGWQPCYFTFGSEGVSVDGTHFLYFFEWDDLKEIIEHQNRLVLRNLNEHVLTIPRRFFEQTNGGDLSWNEMLEFVKKHKPRGSIWS